METHFFETCRNFTEILERYLSLLQFLELSNKPNKEETMKLIRDEFHEILRKRSKR
jgi:hypothetical protein